MTDLTKAAREAAGESLRQSAKDQLLDLGMSDSDAEAMLALAAQAGRDAAKAAQGK